MLKAGYNDTMTTKFIRPLLLISLLAVSASLLSACGKKGSLYIAPTEQVASPAPADKAVVTDKQDKTKTGPAENKNESEAK